MVQLSAVFLGLVALSVNVHAAPVVLSKRIAQTIADSTAKWEQACVRFAFLDQRHTKFIFYFFHWLACSWWRPTV